jgi:hypothetical protein
MLIGGGVASLASRLVKQLSIGSLEMSAVTKIEDSEGQPSTPRFRLGAAINAKDAAAVALEGASVSSIKAADHLRSAEAELEHCRKVVQRLNALHADAIKAAIKGAGDVTLAPPPDTGKARLALAEAEGRSEAARLAHNDLVNEESQSAAALEAATQAVRSAALAAASHEAEVIADEVERLEAEANRLRERLGTSSGMVAMSLKQMSPTVRRVIASSSFITNTPAFHSAARWSDSWRAYLAELSDDTDAKLGDAP